MVNKYPAYFLVLGAIIAGHAGYWFLSGEYESHSSLRTLLVILQAFAGFGVMYWAVKNKPKKAS